MRYPMFLVLLFVMTTVTMASPVLISVELPTMESKKSWHQLNIPTYELIGNTALAVADEQELKVLKQGGYLINIIDRQPDLAECTVVSDLAKASGVKEVPLWQSGQTGIIRLAAKGIARESQHRHQFRAMNTKPLGERFWKQVLTTSIPCREIPYDPVVQGVTDNVNADSITSYIYRLVSFYTRRTLTDSGAAAGQWIYDKFTAWGYPAVFDSFWIIISDSGCDRNVIGWSVGQYNPAREIIIGGHYDSYGTNDPASVAPGADDDATGTAVALEAARVCQGITFESTIKFFGFGGEELGLFGSEHYANSADSQNVDIGAVLNNDMLGWGTFGYITNGTKWLRELLPLVSGKYVPTLLPGGITPPLCDAQPFYDLGYPAIMSSEYSGLSNPYINSVHDSIIYLDSSLYTANIKVQIATMAVLGRMPGPVDSVGIKDVGDGSRLVVQWAPNSELDVNGYKLLFGRQSGVYSDSVYLPGRSSNCDTISGLVTDSTYYVSVWAMDNDAYSSCYAVEVACAPRIVPLAPTDLTIKPKIMSMELNWRSRELDIAGYRIYRKIGQGEWDSLNSALITDTLCVDSVPYCDSIYWYRIRAFDVDGNASGFSDSLGSYTYIPTGLTALPVANGITLCWPLDSTKNISRYSLYRKVNQSAFDSIGQSAYPDTSYVDSTLSGENKYYYRLRAGDPLGNPSRLSDSVYGRPITLDQGVLVVDETYWSSGLYPNDAKQDSFYNYIMAGYKVTEYEYDSIQHKPVLADFGPYSVVVWHGDDNNSLWASYAMNDLRSYFDAGGKVWFVGWKPSGNVRNNAAYPADFGGGSMMYDEFLVSHAELSGSADSFKAATGLKGYPDLNIDTLKYPATIFGKTFRSIEALTPTGTGDTIYVMDMKNNSSLFEGRACAVRDSGKAVFFGFPMYFMDREQAKLAAGKVLEEFGEEPVGVSGGREDLGLVAETRLYQNSPNPFSRETTIRYQINQPGRVSLKVYNIQGQLVKVLDEGHRTEGEYSVKWNGRDNNNGLVSAGVYICHLSLRERTQSRKMIVLK